MSWPVALRCSPDMVGIMVAAGRSNITSANAPVVIIFGIVFLIAGLTAIVRPEWFRNYPVWNPGQPPRPLWSGHNAVTRALGLIGCAIGLAVLILGIVKLA